MGMMNFTLLFTFLGLESSAQVTVIYPGKKLRFELFAFWWFIFTVIWKLLLSFPSFTDTN